MPIDLCGTGSNQRSGAKAPLPAAWSRARPRPTAPGWCLRGTASSTARSADITTARPSGDQLGRPGSFDAVVRLALLARSRRRRCCSCDSGSRKAMRVPSGDHAAVVAAGADPAIAPGPQVANPEVHRRRRDRTRRPARRRPATTPAWSRRRRRGEALGRGLPSRGRHQPQIAERGEGDPRAVGRDRRMHQAAHRLRPFVGEAPSLGRERRPREGDVGRERDACAPARPRRGRRLIMPSAV